MERLNEGGSERDQGRDELLAVRCQLGEPAAFDALVTRFHVSLWKYVRRVTGDDDRAAEALQDVWLRVLRGLPSLRDPGRIRAWMFGVARRTLMDHLRREYAHPPHEPVEAAELAVYDDPPSGPAELEPMLDELERLPVTEREVLVLFYLEELALAEVAEVLCVPVGTVKSRLFRARRLLRERIQTKGDSDDAC